MTEPVRWISTHCSRMDHGGCAVIVGVQDGKIIEIKGDPDGYLNQGYICPKGKNAHKKLAHPERLKTPLERTGARGEGKWRPISWEAALDTIARQLVRTRENFGPESVAFCQGMPKGMEHFALIRLAHTFGSPNVVAVQDVCHAPREVSGLHTCGFYPVTDFHHSSSLILLWGSNPTASNEEGAIHSLLQKQIRQGCRLIVVDPRQTGLARRSDCHLALKPGTDAALALSFLHVIIQENLIDRDFVNRFTVGFEELAQHCRKFSPEWVSMICGVPSEWIRKCARQYATIKPAAIAWGNAIEQHISAWDTTRALVCLMAVTGNLDVPGGNIHALEPPVLSLASFVRSDLVPDKPTRMIHSYFGTVPRMMTVPGTYFRKAILEQTPYPVRAAYMQCCNPLIGFADSRLTRQALLKLDFLAVSEVFPTPTTQLADIVLPAATQFEFDDIGHYGLGHGILLARRKLIEPPPECRPDLRIINDLGKRISRPEWWFVEETEMLRMVLEPTGIPLEEFFEKGYLKGPETFRKHLASGFRTKSGKVNLELKIGEKWGLSTLPDYSPESPNPAFPLLLTSSKSPHYLHSSYRWMEPLRRREPVPVCRIHPETASQAGIREKDIVIIETAYGMIEQTAHLTDRIRPDTICAAYGWWFPEDKEVPDDFRHRSNYNRLTSAHPVGRAYGTPNLKGIPCRIQPKRRNS